ncbi:peptidoglycan binding domain-containing protein [Clostridium chromiireducens]|uniref:L,D-transpeptidase family protein n=1 Tax=Clostridium chromiireducens TaxID=225345 RepID=UPI00289DCAF2|nr:peptidoglycan binding domain-containing protein [Clostridium chromiireducens]
MRRKRKDKSNKVIPGVVVSLSILTAVYLGLSLYFTNHFHFGSIINGIDVSGKTVEEAETKLASEINLYTLELDERGDMTETIKAADIGLKHDSNKIKELKDKQNPFNWISTIFKKDESEASQIVTYDEELLNKTLNNLACITSSNTVEPKNASFEYKDGSYEIIDEVLGNKINKNALHDAVGDAVLNGKAKLDLSASNIYENPKYTSKSQEVIDTKNTLDKYTGLKITYKSGDKTEVLDGSTIHNWLGVNKDMEITFNEDKVKNYVYKISSVFNTFGNTRNFVTTTKKTIQVSGGNYGWIVNNSKEVKDIIEAVKNGQDITKEPAYSQTALAKGSNDIGDTYVEINMTKQHLWFYKNGALVVEGDVVTGNASTNTLTPAGTYVLNYKERNATLVGEDYSSPVEYWMPFNGNIGIHDASWRNEFGKQIYLTNGSHGCVNSPYELAKTIYQNIDAGTPIVGYYE